MGRALAIVATVLVLAGCGLAIAAVTGAFDGADDATVTTPQDDAATSAAADRLRTDRFDRDRAFADLRSQVERGPRPAGSDAARELARWLRDELPRGRIEPVPGGLENVTGRIRGRGKPIVLAAHYDTEGHPGLRRRQRRRGRRRGRARDRPRPAARRPARVRAADPLRAVRRRGEPGRQPRVLLVRPARLQALRAPPRRRSARARPARLRGREGRDADPARGGLGPGLWRRLRAAARKVGAQAAFPARTSSEVLDDHTPFMRRGVPAIDLIDFTFDCWHQTCDDMSAVSARSLDLTGETVTQMLLDFRR